MDGRSRRAHEDAIARAHTRGHGTVRSEGPGKLAARMVAGDEAGAWGVVEAALASGVEAADVYLDLLVPRSRWWAMAGQPAS